MVHRVASRARRKLRTQQLCVPPAGGGGGGGGGGEQAGDFAEKLVAELTAPGGVRAAVPRDQMRKFVAACAARDVCEAVCVLLASCLSAEVRP